MLSTLSHELLTMPHTTCYVVTDLQIRKAKQIVSRGQSPTKTHMFPNASLSYHHAVLPQLFDVTLTNRTEFAREY